MSQACKRCQSPNLVKNGSTRIKCKDCGSSQNKVSARVLDGEHNRYVITCAVEDAPVHGRALKALERYCAEADARLIVIPLKYSWKKKAAKKGQKADKTPQYAKTVAHYLTSHPVEITEQLHVCAQVSVSPTAEMPMSGLHGIAGSRSTIVGHPRMQFQSHPSGPASLSKMQFTTGAITRPRYVKSKVGVKAAFHHVLGALLVEVDDDGTFYPRHICFNADGSFQDLNVLWTTQGPKRGDRVTSYTFGDVHAGVRRKEAFDRQLAPGGSIPLLNPKNVFLHDWFDGESISHHSDKFDRMQAQATKRNLLGGELTETAFSGDLLVAALSSDSKVVVVNSNHDRWIKRWLAASAIPENLPNAILWHEANAYMAREILAQRPTHVFEWLMKKLLQNPERFTFLKPGEQAILKEVDHSQHGDLFGHSRNPGARAFRAAMVKMTVGHSHTPCRYDGVLQVGTCGPLSPSYQGGAYNATFDTDAILYSNGKRTHLNKVKGQFRREDALSKKWDSI